MLGRDGAGRAVLGALAGARARVPLELLLLFVLCVLCILFAPIVSTMNIIVIMINKL
ncbi:MAG: hypothetical protein ACYTE8_10455 [Planctomycetota bacterium]